MFLGRVIDGKKTPTLTLRRTDWTTCVLVEVASSGDRLLDIMIDTMDRILLDQCGHEHIYAWQCI